MKDMLIRAGKTFLQAAIATTSTGIVTMAQTGFTGEQTAIVALVTSAVAAGIAAVMNLPFVKKFFGSGKNEESEENADG